MNTALKRMGFSAVFDTNFSADLTIMEEGAELIQRLHAALGKGEAAPLPQLSSCSPGWVKFIEHFYPDMLSLLSSAKSPQQMFGAVIKTYYAKMHGIDPKDIVSVAVMPCTAKKFECNRPEMNASGFKDVDFGITTRELAKMIREAGIDLPKLPKSSFDDPFETPTGSGVIFGATGGVMEAALRTVIEIVTGKPVEHLFEHADIIPVRGFEGIRLAEITIPDTGPVPDMLKHICADFDWLKGVTLRVGVAHGTANAAKIMEDIKRGGPFSKCHFIELMACSGGCLGGGGQPIPTSPEIRAARAKAIYSEDSAYAVRKSHENPQIIQIYKTFFREGPCGHKAHELLHVNYTPRGKFIA
jgi:NADH-quinone oxidoreductase subunit G/[NiFe] hydrogenase diaphorase moiety small subunit